jgi:ribose 5-phosphate isomerase A
MAGAAAMTQARQPDRDALKRAAAARAVMDVEDGMVLGLGTGSTASFVLAELASRVAAGLSVVGIPTSERSAALARRLGVPLGSFAEHRRIDLTIDGADQVERRTLNMIKGRGGALLREKIVASASARMIVVIDEAKLADRLGGDTLLPVEIVTFGWQTVLERLAANGWAPTLRLAGEEPFVTDGGNYIADCAIPSLSEPAALDARLSAIVGVVETGLFVDMASAIVVGRPAGMEVIERRSL